MYFYKFKAAVSVKRHVLKLISIPTLLGCASQNAGCLTCQDFVAGTSFQCDTCDTRYRRNNGMCSRE